MAVCFPPIGSLPICVFFKGCLQGREFAYRNGVDWGGRGKGWNLRAIELLGGKITQVGGLQVARKRDKKGVLAERKVEQREEECKEVLEAEQWAGPLSAVDCKHDRSGHWRRSTPLSAHAQRLLSFRNNNDKKVTSGGRRLFLLLLLLFWSKHCSKPAYLMLRPHAHHWFLWHFCDSVLSS